MQTRIPLPLLAVIALLTALLPGCAQDDPEAEAGVEVEDITDDAEDANPYFDPVSLIGEEVTVSGEVSDYLDGGGFRISGDEFGDTGLPVVSDGDTALAEGQLVQVTGEVVEFDRDALEAEGYVIDDGFADDLAIAATQVEALEPVTAANEGDLTIPAQLESNDDFEILSGVIVDAGIEELLSNEGPLTVFAPDDEAFEAMPEATMRELSQAENKLADLLRYHVVEGELGVEELAEMDTVTTLQGADLEITHEENGTEGLFINGVPIEEPGFDASNGVIHALPEVLVPPASAS